MAAPHFPRSVGPQLDSQLLALGRSGGHPLTLPDSWAGLGVPRNIARARNEDVVDGPLIETPVHVLSMNEPREFVRRLQRQCSIWSKAESNSPSRANFNQPR